MLHGCTRASSNGSITIRPAAISSRIVWSESTMSPAVYAARALVSSVAVSPSRAPTRGSTMGKTIELRTAVPGPKSQQILERKRRVIADAKSIYLPIAIDRAHGVAVTDVDGNTFLDWTGGIGCLNVGHTNAAVSAALHAQVDRFLHTDFTMVPYESYVELAQRRLDRTRLA